MGVLICMACPHMVDGENLGLHELQANDLRFEPHELPAEIARGHVRVAVRAVGICASDVHYLKKVSCDLHSIGSLACIGRLSH